MLRAGLIVFSPVVHSHPLTRYGLPGNWGFWKGYDRAYLEACSALAVLTLEGWRESQGVSSEIKAAEELGMPYCFIDPGTVGLARAPKSTPTDSALRSAMQSTRVAGVEGVRQWSP